MKRKMHVPYNLVKQFVVLGLVLAIIGVGGVLSGCRQTVTRVYDRVEETSEEGLRIAVVEDLITKDAPELDFVAYMGEHMKQYSERVSYTIYPTEYGKKGFTHDAVDGDYDYVVAVLGSGVKGMEEYDADRGRLTTAIFTELSLLEQAAPADAVLVIVYDSYAMEYESDWEAGIEAFCQLFEANRTICAIDMNDHMSALQRSVKENLHAIVGEYIVRQIGGLEALKNTMNQTALDPNKPVIALTFDDGPNTTTTNQILDVLEQYEVPGTFFLVGSNINASTEPVVARQLSLGCEVASHSNVHAVMTEMTPEEIREDMSLCAEKIYHATGAYPTFFRPPYIAVNNTMYANINMPFISGYGCNDWDAAVNVQTRIDSVLSHAKDGEVILLHDAAGNHQTVEALPAIIEGLQEQGYQFATCTQLFAIKNIIPTTGITYTTVFDGN